MLMVFISDIFIYKHNDIYIIFVTFYRRSKFTCAGVQEVILVIQTAQGSAILVQDTIETEKKEVKQEVENLRWGRTT